MPAATLSSRTVNWKRSGACPGSFDMAISPSHVLQSQPFFENFRMYPTRSPVEYVTANDDEALAALNECCAAEGILPAIESSHALAGAKHWAARHPGGRVLVGLSGRGDKDMPILAKYPLESTGAERAHAAA